MQINEGFFLILKLNKNVISLNDPFISLGRIKLSYFLMWKQYTWPILFWNAIAKICNAFVYFLFFTIRVAASAPQSNTAFYRTDRWNQRRQKRKTLKHQPPTSFQDSPHRTLTALLGVSQSSCGHKTPCTDSGLLLEKAFPLLSRSKL